MRAVENIKKFPKYKMTGLYYCKSIVLQLKQQQADNIIYET